MELYKCYCCNSLSSTPNICYHTDTRTGERFGVVMKKCRRSNPHGNFGEGEISPSSPPPLSLFLLTPGGVLIYPTPPAQGNGQSVCARRVQSTETPAASRGQSHFR